MSLNTYGNIIYISYDASELSRHEQTITLPDGYSYEDILVLSSNNISTIQNRLLAKAFEPILVVGDDGKKYNVIPSDQFK